MTTYILTKKQLIETIEKFEEGNKVFLLSNSTCGSISATGKKGKELKKLSFAFIGNCFKNPGTVSDIIQSWRGGLIVMDKKYISDQDLKALEDIEKMKKEGEKINNDI